MLKLAIQEQKKLDIAYPKNLRMKVLKNVSHRSMKTYYKLSIEILRQVHQNYLNLIESQIVNLRILKKVIDVAINQIKD